MEDADEALMLAYRAGDAAAFDRLYARYKGALFRFVLRSVRERAAAEEFYQEIWMRVIESRSRYAPQAKFSTWLYTIAHNRLVDAWRKGGLALVSLDCEDDPPPEPAAPPSSDPQRTLEARERLARFLRALGALPAAQREAFLLREEAGLSIAEIAKVTGADEEAAKSRLRYALAKLKEATGDE
jgi:RNA polymerase sigma-70 factor (ECF subfamily)